MTANAFTTSCGPGPVQATQSSQQSCWGWTVMVPILQWKHGGPEGMIDLPNIAQLESGGAGTRTQASGSALFSDALPLLLKTRDEGGVPGISQPWSDYYSSLISEIPVFKCIL